MELRLTQEEINNLIAIHKTLKNKNDADKVKCIIYWGKGWSWEQIKEILFISDHYIHDTVNKYKKGNIEELLKNNLTGHNYKMTGEQEKQFIEYLDDNFIANAKMACQYIKEQFGIEYTADGMVLTLKRLGYRYKKPKKVPGKIPDEAIQKEFAENTNKTIDNLKPTEASYFTDGSGLVHNVNSEYGWIRKGKDKIIKTNTGRQKMNINGAYNPVTNETICIEQEGTCTVNQDSNIKLIDKIKNLHPEFTKIYLFMDNAKSNKGKMFKEYIINLNDLEVEIVYLPAYSPNLNLIERLWKYSKKELLSKYYDKFFDFKEKVISFFEEEINKDYHRKKLSTFIGRKFQIIPVDT
jgi:transposase